MKLVPHYWLIYCSELYQQRYYMQIIINPEGSIISWRNFLQKVVTTIIFYLFTLLFLLSNYCFWYMAVLPTYMCPCTNTRHTGVLGGQKMSSDSLVLNEGLEGCKLPCAHQKLNPDQWKSSQVLLTSEPALEPLAFKKGFILAYSLSQFLLIQ